MKTYYIHNTKESSGPFTLEELKAKQITKTTLVWTEGMDEWKHAGDIDELKSFFSITPPPLKSIPPTPVEEKTDNPTIFGIKKNTFFLASALLILIIAKILFNNYQEDRNLELEQKNHQTELHNIQIEQQQKELDEQKIQSVIQEKIIAENRAKTKKDSINNRLFEIKKLLAVTNTNLEEEKNNLIDAQKFKLLRSEDKKIEEINQIQINIKHWQSEIKKLTDEADRLYLVLETIH